MKACYYYSFNDNRAFGSINACSISSTEFPLTVNCAGRTIMTRSFTTYNTEGREDYYFIYVEQGNMNVYFDGVEHGISVGNIVVFPPKYNYKYAFEGSGELSYLWVHFTGAYAKKLLADCGIENLPCVINSKPDHKTVSLFRRIFEIYESGDKLRGQRLACTLEELIINTAMTANEDASDRTLERSLGYIHEHYNTDIRIPELAKAEHLSNSRYVVLFRERMGIPPSEYIINLRMNVACDLLRNTDMSIKQVALTVGYEDSHFFSKLFKKKTGVPPLKFRK